MVAATGLIAAGYGSAFFGPRATHVGAWILAVGLAALMPATMALGAPRTGRRARVVHIALWCTFVVLLASFGAALALPPDDPTAPLVLGFPLRAAIVLYGAGVVPLFALPLVYAWTFDDGAATDAAHGELVAGASDGSAPSAAPVRDPPGDASSTEPAASTPRS